MFPKLDRLLLMSKSMIRLLVVLVAFHVVQVCANNWSLWNHKSDAISFTNITSVPSNTVAMSVSKITYNEASCESLVLTWFSGSSLNYRVLYCYFKYGWYFQDKGFHPFFFLMEQQNSTSLSPFDVPVSAHSRSFTSVAAHPATYAVASSQDNFGVVLGLCTCWSLSAAYVGQTCGSTFIGCSNSQYDRDSDILGRCRYQLRRGLDLHEPKLASAYFDETDISATSELYHHIDIPETDGVAGHRNPGRSEIPHTAASFFALRDLTGNGYTDVVFGGIVRTPINLWTFHSFPKRCCTRSGSLNSASGSAIESSTAWRRAIVGTGSVSISSGSAGWEIISSRLVYDGSVTSSIGWTHIDTYAERSMISSFSVQFGIMEMERPNGQSTAGSTISGNAGVIFGRRNSNNFYSYVVDFSSNRHHLFKVVNGARSTLGSAAIPSYTVPRTFSISTSVSVAGVVSVNGIAGSFSFSDLNAHHGSFTVYVSNVFGGWFSSFSFSWSAWFDTTVNRDPAPWSLADRNNKICDLKLWTHEYSSATEFTTRTINTGSFPAFSNCPSVNSPLLCSSSWINLDSDARPDLLLQCTVGTTIQYRVGMNWGIAGPTSWITMDPGDLEIATNTKTSFQPIRFGNRPTMSSGTFRIEPLLLITEANGVLRYRHLFRK
ncbi:hypothetical protein GEMRC1_004433 [Eukaryota sp. GEM-RC1]